ncbi:hypothetical protein AC1031_003856 [Aphanomyces cochlioides]|nr:hypothetical protein AC1031_003856 [Aphanomyces cochlioides]
MPPRKADQTKLRVGNQRQDEKSTSKRVLWTKDAVADGKTSMDVIINWMSNETNYKRWKGGDKTCGSRKASLASEIVTIMSSHGIHHRTIKDVVQKIGDIERSYRAASDWLGNTGQGVEDEASVEKEVKRICPYYYILDDVMRDRASTAPLLTSDNLDDNDESDGTRTPEQKKIPNSDKKRSANVAKLDEWVDINSRVYDLKRDQFQFTRDVESRKLEVDIQREARLAKETKVNIRLLTIQAEEAQWKFEHNREMAEVAARIKKIEIRRELKEKGWTDSEIDQACPFKYYAD